MGTPANYEEILAAEGLAPLDSGSAVSSRGHFRRGNQHGFVGGRNSKRLTPGDHGEPEATAAYLAWAGGVLRSASFQTPYQRRVWELHAEGKSKAETVRILERERPTSERRYPSGKVRVVHVKPSPHSVGMALDRVRRLLPLPPVKNPWRKSGEQRVALTGGELAAFVKKVTAKLRRVAADERELQRLIGECMGADKNGMQRYSRILLEKNHSLRVPGVSVDRAVLSNIDGRPHAGGIDVTLPTETAKNGRRKTRFTIPWHAVMQSEVDEGEDDGAQV